MVTIDVFKSFNLTKRSRITLEEGQYLGDTADDLAVYSLYNFWVILDEDFSNPYIPSYAAMKSAEAVEVKPYIETPFEEDDVYKID